MIPLVYAYMCTCPVYDGDRVRPQISDIEILVHMHLVALSYGVAMHGVVRFSQ